jgi:radical SAM superfamily enzyme YgiQ (UPF0313 family)
MNIGMIAMSGVRAWSDELNQASLTMPGFVERGKVIASMPSLSLLTLAALTPDEHDISYHEIPKLDEHGPLPEGFDLVAIATYSAQVSDAYKLADHYRAQGIPVVMGGLHVSVEPTEALQHASAVVIGEAEPLWPGLIADAERGELHSHYGPVDQPFDLADAPIPRYDLLDHELYNRFPLTTSRGCPFRCEFCASSILISDRYKVKPVERVLAELHAIKQTWEHPFIEFADDNSFVNRRHYHELLAALRDENIKWFTECDVSVADDPQLLDLMRESGCRQVLIGLESPRSEGLDGLELRGNWKLKQIDRYEAAIHAIQRQGITVNGCFILGLDGHTPDIFDAVYDYSMRLNLWDVQITVLTPFPGTPLYDRLLKQGRILRPGVWDTCTLFDVNFEPTGMSANELQQGLLYLAGRVYSKEAIDTRRRGFFDNLDRSLRQQMKSLVAG